MSRHAVSPVKLAILGAGTMGTIHGLAAQQASEAEVVAVWSRSPDRAQELASRLGADASPTEEAVLARDDVEAVLVCTPTPLHHPQALAALSAGKHVFCEKPLARTLDQGQEMVDAAARAGRLLYVGHVLRFFAEFRRLHDLVGEGAVGRPALVRLSRAAAYPHGRDLWHQRTADSGGVVLDMAIHDLDWLLWTFGPVQRVYGRGLVGRDLPELDYALLTLRTADGTMAHVEASWAEAEGLVAHGEVSGDAGLLTYDSRATETLSISLRQPPETPRGVNVPVSQNAESPMLAQLRHFCRCVRGLEQPLVPPGEALEALRLALAALDAIGTGRPVDL